MSDLRNCYSEDDYPTAHAMVIPSVLLPMPFALSTDMRKQLTSQQHPM